MSEARRVHVVVLGDVQGVGFRWFTRERAQHAGIRGWVRNMPDGNVELVAEGAPASVQRFLDAVRRGPSRSRVTDLQIRDEKTEQELAPGFDIRR